MKYKTIITALYLFQIVLISSCWANQNDLVLNFYSKDGKLIFSVQEQDILCFDWEHQSFLLTDRVRLALEKMPDLLSGLMRLNLKGQDVYEVDIISDNMTYDYGKPKLVFEDEGLFFFFDNWIFIRYLKNNYEQRDNESLVFDELLNENLFNYLQMKGKLNCKNWTFGIESKSAYNIVDMEPHKTAERVFNNK